MKPFQNEEYLDFSDPKILKKQQKALEAVQDEFGKTYPNFIGDREAKSKDLLASVNPSCVDEVIGTFPKASRKDVDHAFKAAEIAFESWKNVSAEERANYLFKAAKEIRKRRYEINAWMIFEVGKSYLEADADTCEAIDFLEFYGREAIRYSEQQPLTKYPGEKNSYFYIPLGIGVVIPPWNFPFAILVGMTAAAIVTGNTVIVKPSSESPMMGWLFADIMRQVGLPSGVLNYVVGSGGEIGDYLVEHPKTRFISFTGSKEVGLSINEKAAKTSNGQIWIKRVISEMGGKDAIIVDSEADVDAAVNGTVAAAFGFQGQKCSACSRVIVDAAVYDEFVEKVRAKVEALTYGPAKDNHDIGPVVSNKAKRSILEYIDIGRKEGRLIIGGTEITKDGNHIQHEGYYIQPTVFVDVPHTARIAQEEIFGPVLAVIKAKDFDNALEIANGTIYGLTGAVYSLNKKKLERATREFHVGNLYLNRKCTGALVDVHPFGGYNMSGTCSKAGSRDYLLLFLQGKSVAEKILNS